MARLVSLLSAFVLVAACTVGEGIDSAQPGSPDAAAQQADGGGGGGGGGGGDGSGDGDGTGGGGGGGDGEPTAQTVLEEFGGCMTLADWEAQNLGAIALLEAGDQGQQCNDCHSAGQNGNYLNADSTLTFENIRTYPYILKYAETDADLNPIPSTAIADKALASQQGGHLPFTLPDDLALGIEAFFNLTKERYDADECAGL